MKKNLSILFGIPLLVIVLGLGTLSLFTGQTGTKELEIDTKVKTIIDEMIETLEQENEKFKATADKLTAQALEIQAKAQEELDKVQINEEIIQSAIKKTTNGYLPDERNSKGELHPRVKYSYDLKDFVRKHCVADVYAEYDNINAYATSNSVDPAVVYAIAWSETGCGHNMTTYGNIGNVGNTNSGARRSNESVFLGAKAIVDTLNNKYMSGLTMVGHLSQDGRDRLNSIGVEVKYHCLDAPAPFKCYAVPNKKGDVVNAGKNIVRALRSIKNDMSIDSNWEFRI